MTDIAYGPNTYPDWKRASVPSVEEWKMLFSVKLDESRLDGAVKSAIQSALEEFERSSQTAADLKAFQDKVDKALNFNDDGTVTVKSGLQDKDGKPYLTKISAEEFFLSKSDLENYLPMSGGTVTGEIDISGSDGRGGICASMMPFRPEKAYLQLQGKPGEMKPAIVFYDGNSGWKTWVFDPASGGITDPNNQIAATQDWAKNRFLQLPTGSPPLKIQAFSVTGGANNGSPRITFPEAFSKTLSVSAIVNQTPGSFNSRFVNLLNTSVTNNEVRVDNTGFNCQIVYVLGGGGAGTTGDPWTMLVTATGVA